MSNHYSAADLKSPGTTRAWTSPTWLADATSVVD